MAFNKGNSSICLRDLFANNNLTEADIISYYLGLNKIPCVIKSPLRIDKKPSFSIYTRDGIRIHYKDFSTGESGGIYDLLGNMWGCTFNEVIDKIYHDLSHFLTNNNVIVSSKTNRVYKLKDNNSELHCKIREWKDHDIDYWNSFGISLAWLKYAEVYPISHKIIIKNGHKYVFSADKFAYAYVEHKEGNITLKIYQPFNTKGYKWSNKHDSSVISLWTKVPAKGKKLCICSSVKDALCLWANTGIPSISVQGEGYSISDTAIKELRKRYDTIYICFDNDPPGIKDAEKLSKRTGFINVVLPIFNGGKDISDLMKIKGKEEFLKIILPLFQTN